MCKIIKRTIYISLIIIIFLSIAYLFVMGMLKGTVSFDISSWIKSYSEDCINLCFGIRIGEFSCKGVDEYNNKYLMCISSLPNIFEDNEIYVILSLDTGKAVAYIGPSRGMELVYEKDFPNINWR